MSGTFSSRAQAEANPEQFYDIRLIMEPIWQSRADGPWLYVEQAAADSLDRPCRQRVYRLSRIDEQTVKSEIYTLPGDPLALAGVWKEDSPLQQFGPEDLELRSGCAILLHRINPETYAGSTHEQQCPSTLRGASYATSDVVLTPAQLLSWDRGYDSEDQQVWGAVAGPYAFLKDLR